MTAEERIKKALQMIADFGDTDGGHHKQWALDQVVRILTDCPDVIKESKYRIGEEHKTYTYTTLGESEEYYKWLRDYADGEDGPHTYRWSIGTPP
jgi:hypothetical protein